MNKTQKVIGSTLLIACASLLVSVGHSQPAATTVAAQSEWPTYGGNLASHRYSPLDQIDKDNFGDLEIAWRLRTDFLGPRPDTLYSATPLYVNGVLYTTAGRRRAAVALDPATGEMIWMHSENEGERGDAAARGGAGRGLAYWSNGDASDERIIYVTPGYRMLALDANTGMPVSSFGENGVVDLKQDFDQEIDPVDSDVGLNATPLVVGDVVVVGAAHRPAGSMDSTWDVRGYVRGYDVHSGERLWTFHTIPLPGEFGYETWEDGSAGQNGNTLGANERGSGTRPGLLAGRDAVVRLQRLQSSRRRSVRRVAGRRRRQNRGAPVALSDGASRPLGCRPAMRSDPVRHAAQRPHDQGAGATDQDGVSVRVEPGNG